jgi:hypothetical protein
MAAAPCFTPVPGTTTGGDWKNELQAFIRDRGARAKTGSQSKGAVWVLPDGSTRPIEPLRELAKFIYNSPEFISVYWPLVSKQSRPSPSTFALMQWSAKRSINCLNKRELEFFRMLDDPKLAASCSFHFFLIRPLRPLTFFCKASTYQYRPYARLEKTQVPVASILYRVAYPDSIFHRGFHLSHLVGNLGQLSRFCVSPASVVLESASQNKIRESCSIRWENIVSRNVSKAIVANFETTSAQVIFFATLEAQRSVCCGHEPPVCQFAAAEDETAYVTLHRSLQQSLTREQVTRRTIQQVGVSRRIHDIADIIDDEHELQHCRVTCPGVGCGLVIEKASRSETSNAITSHLAIVHGKHKNEHLAVSEGIDIKPEE